MNTQLDPKTNKAETTNKQDMNTKVEKEAQDPPLRGTFASVLLLGAFLAVTWFAVFILFLSRQ